MRATCASSREASSSSEGSGPAGTQLCHRAAQWLPDPGSSSQRAPSQLEPAPPPGHTHRPRHWPHPPGHTHPIPGHTHLAPWPYPPATPTQSLVTSTPPPDTSTPMGSARPTALGCRPAGSGELPSPEPGVSPYRIVSPVSHLFSFSRHLQ